MEITADTWAVVLATATGPIIAVAITLAYTYINEARSAKYGRRLMLFTTLMATRKIPLSPEHVSALNMIEVVFYGKPSVLEKWRTYIAHLTDNLPNPNDNNRMAEWSNRKDRLLAALLFEISKIVGFRIPEIEIFQGGYSPQGWSDREDLQLGALAFFNDLSTGKKIVPLWVMGPPQLWGGQQREEPGDQP